MTYWIADLCSNHGGSISVAKEMISAAADVGFDAAKVQFLNPRAMYRAGDERIEKLSRYVLSLDQLTELAEHARGLDLELGASVFAPEDVDEVAARVDFLKIASSESQWQPLVDAVAGQNEVDWMISTPPGWYPPRGWDDLMGRGRLPCARLHCVPIYPCPAELACISLVEKLDGYSDHTRNFRVVADAVVLYGAEYVELHWMCDGQQYAPEREHSWSPDSFGLLLDEIAIANVCDGDDEVAKFVADEFWEKTARDLRTGYRR